MPRVHHVKSARKDYPNADIKKGDEYWWWKFNYGPKVRSRTYPRSSQLTRSEFLSWYYDLQDRIDSLDSKDAIIDDVNDIIGEIESMKDELQDKLDNMPDSLRESSGSGELLQERIDALEDWVSSLSGIDCEHYIDDTSLEIGLMEIGVADEENATNEQIDEARDILFTELLDEIKSTDPGMS